MKKLITLFLTIFLSLTVSAQSFQSPDVLVDTKLNSDWSGLLVSKIRKILRNYGQADPFRAKIEKPITVVESQVAQYLNPEAKELLAELGGMLEMDFLHGEAKVVVHGLRYDVKGFKTDLKLTDEINNGVTISADFAASNVRVNADKIVISLMIPGKKSLPAIEIEIIKPIVVASEESLVNFFTKIKLKSEADSYKLKMEEADFAHMAQGLLNNDSVSLNFSSVVVPQVSIKIGNKVLKFDQKKIENLIFSKKEAIKGLVLAQFSSLLEKGFGTQALKAMDDMGFKKEFWINTVAIQSYLKLNSFKSFANGEHVLAHLDGDFCTQQSYQTHNQNCVNNKTTKAPKSRLTEREHQASLDIMHDMVEEGDANIVVSISEDYINQALVATLDAGLWNKMLEKAGVMLGLNKPFLRLDKKDSTTGTLYMDMVYTPKKIQQMALGTKVVRFPLALQVGLEILQDKRVPIFKLFIKDVDLSDDMLLNGRPELGVVSNIKSLRFKKKVLEQLRLETKGLPNTEIVRLNYPALRGLDLDKVDFLSDGQGRMNALILLKESVETEGEEAK
jgi:hypothetical protein